MITLKAQNFALNAAASRKSLKIRRELEARDRDFQELRCRGMGGEI